MLRADHRRQLIPPRTPEARVAAELSLRAHTLREQYPGAHAQAPRQKDANIERRPRPDLSQSLDRTLTGNLTRFPDEGKM